MLEGVGTAGTLRLDGLSRGLFGACEEPHEKCWLGKEGAITVAVQLLFIYLRQSNALLARIIMVSRAHAPYLAYSILFVSVSYTPVSGRYNGQTAIKSRAKLYYGKANNKHAEYIPQQYLGIEKKKV